MPLFDVFDLRVTHGLRTVLSIDRLSVNAGELLAVSGPNGAGKSTLLSVLSGLNPHFQGRCLFRDRDVRSWARREFAKEIAVVHQSRPTSFPFTVEEVVLMGRSPHSTSWFENPFDVANVDQALSQAAANDLRGREFRTLSGGEQQRVLLAAALAQEPKVLLLDEPLTFLDLQHQLHLYHLLAALRDCGVLIICVTHDLNLAAAYADRLLLLKEGRCVADGRPGDILTPALIHDVFEVQSEFWRNEEGRIWMRYGV
jgi:iron complex transport system ATP-binding protein